MAGGRPFQRIMVAAALAFVILTTSFGCASAVINLGEDGGSISHPILRECPGVRFRLTIEPNSTDRQSVSIESIAAAGFISFKSRDLTGNVLNGLVTLRLEVLEVPNNSATVECPFRLGEVYRTGFKLLRPVRMVDGDAIYEVDLDDFVRQ
jgi:hypothetical protein